MIGLVHLVWVPLGLPHLQRFVAAYHRHPAGVDHELVVLLNGLTVAAGDPDALRSRLLDELNDTPHRLIELDQPMLDLAAYAEAASRLETSTVCFLNSYSEALVDGWLGHLERALAQPGVAMAGASGSWESQSEWRPGRPVEMVHDLLRLPSLRRIYPRFPNPHLRTNAFAVDRERLLSLGLERARDKRSAYRLESGVHSISTHIRRAGQRLVVVDCDGVAHDEPDWPTSRTFRSGNQERLLVADNQTRCYDAASPSERRRLSRNTWGRLT